MESARMNSHIFALNRKPKRPNMTIGDYFIGDVDSIAICEPMLMNYDCANDVFCNPQTYNPLRFMGENKEPKSSSYVMTWGSGVHLCPGKQFAICEIKIALSLICTNFERFILSDSQLEKVNYFSPSAFSERMIMTSLKPLITTIQYKNQVYKIQSLPSDTTPTRLYNQGWLIRKCLFPLQQKELYQYTIDLSKQSSEQTEIGKIPHEQVYPITYYNLYSPIENISDDSAVLVYTNKSNCSLPKVWFQWAEEIWDMMMSHRKLLNFNGSEPQFNSLYAQLYGINGQTKVHTYEYMSWKISISLGASCHFRFNDQDIILSSGDVLISDFSKVDHEVVKIYDDTPPWFSQVETFGRVRCSIQIGNEH